MKGRFCAGLLAAALGVACFASLAAAKEPIEGLKRVGIGAMSFLKIPQSARAAGMGTAYTSVCDDASAGFWNPAGIANVDRFSYSVSYVRWLVGSNVYSGALAYRFGGSSVGLTVMSFQPDAMEETTIYQPAGTGRMIKSGDLAIGLVYAKRMTDKFAFGGRIRWANQTLDYDAISTVLFDVGTYFETGFTSLRLSMTLRNLGQDQSVGSGGSSNVSLHGVSTATYVMPMVYTIGVGMEVVGQKGDPMYLTLSAENLFVTDWKDRYHLGAELVINNAIALRSGYKSQYDIGNFSAGLGIKHDLGDKTFTVDASYTHVGERLNNPFMVTVGGAF